LQARINWFGFAGGVTVVLLIAVSIFVPWWQLIVGDSLVEANVSPIYTNFDLLDNAFTIPLLLALNVSCIILMAAGGVAILIYSIKPGASYSNRLLGFGYRKPLYSLILFVVGLVAIVLIVKSVLGLEVPLIGSGNTMLPPEMTQGATVSVLMTAGFQWPFLLAIVATALCIAARFYHKSAVPSQKTAGTDIPPSPPASTTTT
jgi:hypothetical protein